MTTDVSTNKLKINVLTRTQYDSAEKSNDELYFVEESETNTWLIAVTDVAPATANVNDRYYNSNTKLIYTWNGSTWTNAISPTPDDLYINKTDNSTYAWDGTNLIQIGSTGGITTDDIDGTTITLNSSNKIQAAGVINKNDGTAKYDWIGTKLEYDALEEIHNDWIYYITDDEYASGNMSLSNVYNRLNRAYAWTYRHVNGSGNVYNIYYYNGNVKVSNAFQGTNVIGPTGCDKGNSGVSNHIIVDGKLYYKSQSNDVVNMVQIGTDTTWTNVGGGYNTFTTSLAINNGDLYVVTSNSATLKNSGGWQKISGCYTSLGIKNDSLYLITNSANTITEIDSSGIWTDINGNLNSSSYYMIGIKDGKLYKITISGVVTEISSDTNWSSVKVGSNSNIAYAINNGDLYVSNGTNVKLINNTEIWKKITGGLGITETGKLYKFNMNYTSPTITQIGTDTTWTDVSGSDSSSIGINNGNAYYNLTLTTGPIQLTTSGGITNVYGVNYMSLNYPSASFWTGSVTEDVHTVYTIPSPQTGYHTYADENLSVVSTITAVNMNNNTITDGLYTYTRDSAADKIFTAVSPDSKNQLVSMADLLNAIKG